MEVNKNSKVNKIDKKKDFDYIQKIKEEQELLELTVNRIYNFIIKSGE
jgi:hypothetical protein